MNEQAVSQVEKKPPGAGEPELAVEEIFYTIQGEGPFAGQPACFIRLSGCTLCCSPCDTNYSTFLPYTVERAALQAERFTPPIAELCVITGGEPFRQYHLIELVERLLERFAIVQIETSGSCYQARFDELMWKHGNRISVVCSPKTAKLHKGILRWIDAYKYVVRAGAVAEDGLPDEEPQYFKKVKVARPSKEDRLSSIPVYVQPWDEHDAEKNSANMVAAVASCLQHGYLLSLQLHKIVNLP